ncbi:MAG: type II toxin-antitoxin system HicB family antitoxin [bacterium]
MDEEYRYVKIVEWSDEDGCFIGSCPELFYGGCHGDNEYRVFDELCQIVEETIRIYRQDGKPLPSPLSGRELVNTLQKVA